jgi:hypothetical protein
MSRIFEPIQFVPADQVSDYVSSASADGQVKKVRRAGFGSTICFLPTVI